MLFKSGGRGNGKTADFVNAIEAISRFSVRKAEAEAAISRAYREWREALRKLEWDQCATLEMRQDLLFYIIKHKHPIIFECFSFRDVWEQL